MTTKQRKAPNGAILYYGGQDNGTVELSFEEANIEWDHLLGHFDLTRNINNNIQFSFGLMGTSNKTLRAMYVLAKNIDAVLKCTHLTTFAKRDLKRCLKDVMFLLDILERNQ